MLLLFIVSDLSDQGSRCVTVILILQLQMGLHRRPGLLQFLSETVLQRVFEIVERETHDSDLRYQEMSPRVWRYRLAEELNLVLVCGELRVQQLCVSLNSITDRA